MRIPRPPRLNLLTLIVVFAILKPFIENVLHMIPNTPVSATLTQIALCSWALVLLVFRHSIKAIFNTTLLPLLVMVAYFRLSLGWSYDVPFGTEKWTIWLINAVLPATAIYGLMTRARQQINWGYFLFFAAIFGGVSLLYGNGDRNSIEGLNVIWTGRIALTALTVTLFLRFNGLLKLILAALFALVAFEAESRGPVLAFLVPMSIYVVWQGVRGMIVSRNVSAATSAAVLFAVIPVILGATWLLDNLSVLTDSRFFALLQNSTADDGVNSRSEMIAVAIQSWQTLPIFGEGLGGFSRYYPQYYPHNVFAELACETGLVGLALLGTVLLRAIRAFSTQRIMLVLLFIQSFGYALFSGSLEANQEYFIFFAVLTGAAMSYRPETDTKGESAFSPTYQASWAGASSVQAGKALK